MLDPDQHKYGTRAEKGYHPQDKDDGLHPALSHHHLGSEGEADGEVAFHAQRRDVQYGGVGAALAYELEELAELLAKIPRPVPPDPVQVQGHTQEDQQVRESHAGQVQIGGRPHVLILTDH